MLNAHYPPLRYLTQLEEEGFFMSMHSQLLGGDTRKLVLTFDELLRRTNFAEAMRKILQLLELQYRAPVDLEFTLHLDQLESGLPKATITVLQCRPLSHLFTADQEPIPTDLSPEDMIFSTHFVVPQGYIPRANYVIFVPPEGYFALKSLNQRHELARTIGRLNAALEKETFILIGPGRWGSSNTDLGCQLPTATSTTPGRWWNWPGRAPGQNRKPLWARTSSRTCWKRRSTPWLFCWTIAPPSSIAPSSTRPPTAWRNGFPSTRG